jgi:glycerol 2-dehydrogenase (NADP+)
LKAHDIQPQAFSPLGGMGGQHLRQHPTVLAIGQKYGVHGAVVLISWLLKRGIQPLPKSVFENEIRANIARKFDIAYLGEALLIPTSCGS